MPPVKPKTRRLFFAFWPDETVRRALELAAKNTILESGGRPIPVSNWHTTLAFLGAVEENRMSEIADAAAALRFEPFDLTFNRIEHWSIPAILCVVATKPPPAAQALVIRLQEALARKGFAPDPKPWRPHVTIARKVSKSRADEPIQPIRWQVRNVVLVESETRPEGARYTVCNMGAHK